jgi:hypothetical protein
MRSLSIQDTKVLVLPDDGEPRTKGALFERFIARLLAEHYGFEQPTTQSINVTSDGIELDVVATHRLTGGKAIAECKAYSRTVKAAELAAFYGKLAADRLGGIDTFGVMFALPRLTGDGAEKAREIESKDRNFRYLSAVDLAAALRQSSLIADRPDSIRDSSDHAVVITEHGVFAGSSHLRV